MEANEDFLKNRLIKGDEKAFQEIFEGHWEKTYCFCLYYTRDEEDAKDLTQTVFAYLWQQRHKLSLVQNLQSYLAGVARFQCFHYVRQKVNRRQKLAEIHPMSSGIAEPFDDPDRLLEYKQFSEHTEKFIANLPEPGKTIFMMSRELNLTYQQIAVQRGISVKTVQYHISAMLRILRENIKKI